MTLAMSVRETGATPNVWRRVCDFSTYFWDDFAAVCKSCKFLSSNVLAENEILRYVGEYCARAEEFRAFGHGKACAFDGARMYTAFAYRTLYLTAMTVDSEESSKRLHACMKNFVYYVATDNAQYKQFMHAFEAIEQAAWPVKELQSNPLLRGRVLLASNADMLVSKHIMNKFLEPLSSVLLVVRAAVDAEIVSECIKEFLGHWGRCASTEGLFFMDEEHDEAEAFVAAMPVCNSLPEMHRRVKERFFEELCYWSADSHRKSAKETRALIERVIDAHIAYHITECLSVCLASDMSPHGDGALIDQNERTTLALRRIAFTDAIVEALDNDTVHEMYDILKMAVTPVEMYTTVYHRRHTIKA